MDEKVAGSEYQALHHFVSLSPWDERVLLDQISKDVDRLLGGRPNTGLYIDPSAMPKKGKDSVGVGRQWCGRLGKVDNCQLGVFAGMGHGSEVCLINKRLYLPKSWTEDSERCSKAKIPDECREYKSTADLALELIEDADRNELRYGFIALDSEFGKQPWFMEKLNKMEKQFVIDVHKDQGVYINDPRVEFSPVCLNKMAPRSRLRFKPKKQRVDEVVARLPRRAWKTIKLRDSTKGVLKVEVLHLKVWVWNEPEEQPHLWHLIAKRERSNLQKTKLKYSLSNAPIQTSTKILAYRQAQRFWVEHGIKIGKQEAGMAEYQVRLWRGWNHHIALGILASLFMLEARIKNSHISRLLTHADIRDILTLSFAGQGLHFHRKNSASSCSPSKASCCIHLSP